MYTHTHTIFFFFFIDFWESVSDLTHILFLTTFTSLCLEIQSFFVSLRLTHPEGMGSAVSYQDKDRKAFVLLRSWLFSERL